MVFLNRVCLDEEKSRGFHQTLPIVETFHSVQGEGAWVGTNAFFIRLGGCDVGCSWCDTKQSWPVNRHTHQRIQDLVAAAQAVNPAIVVVTGGEPLMHDLTGLTEGLRDAGLRVHLETSGVYCLRGTFDWITLSPKSFRPPDERIYSRVHELKVVISCPEDLNWAQSQAMRVPVASIKWLQPEWSTPSSLQWIMEYVLQHPEWRVSIQTHKYLQVR